MKIGLYARVSTEDQNTLPMQIQTLQKYVASRNWTVALQVEDIGSGAKERPKRDALLKAARRREIDAILVWKLDRWGRSVTDLFNTLKELSQLGVGFISFTEALDLTTSTGRAMAGLLAVFAEFERDLIRERVKAGIAHARKLGKPHGRPLTVANQTNEIKSLFRKGFSKSKIAKTLNISRTSVRRLLAKPDDPNIVYNNFPTPPDLKKKITLKLWLCIENNNKFVRGKGKVRDEIERRILSEYNFKKPYADSYDYEITIPYENDKDLDEIIYEMLSEMSCTADYRNCFIETDVRTLDDEKNW